TPRQGGSPCPLTSSPSARSPSSRLVGGEIRVRTTKRRHSSMYLVKYAVRISAPRRRRRLSAWLCSSPSTHESASSALASSLLTNAQPSTVNAARTSVPSLSRSGRPVSVRRLTLLSSSLPLTS